MEKIDSTTLFPLLVEASETDFWQKRYDEKDGFAFMVITDYHYTLSTYLRSASIYSGS